jgi:ribosomal protein S18 acetylase RimI-like enzyme
MTDAEDGAWSIRDCRPEDALAILELWRQAGSTPGTTDSVDAIRRLLASNCAFLLLAEVQGHAIGSIIGTFDGWRGNIYRLAVHPDYRRRGIARELVREAETRLRRMGGGRITALVEHDHPLATGFWAGVGYVPDRRITRYIRNI